MSVELELPTLNPNMPFSVEDEKLARATPDVVQKHWLANANATSKKIEFIRVDLRHPDITYKQ